MRYSPASATRSEEHTSELQSQSNLVCRLLLEKKKKKKKTDTMKQNATSHYRCPPLLCMTSIVSSFFFTDPATTEIYTLSLHDALPIFDQVGTLRGDGHHQQPAVAAAGDAQVFLGRVALADEVLAGERNKIGRAHV